MAGVGMVILFWVVALITIGSAVATVAMKNAVYSALCLVANLFCVAVLFAMLQAHFLAAVQIIVYAGAIMVLFLFVVMLLNLKAEVWRPRDTLVAASAGLAAVLFLLQVLPVIFAQFGAIDTNHSDTIEGGVAALGRQLYGRYSLLFQASGVLLMTALVGAMLLAKKRFKKA